MASARGEDSHVLLYSLANRVKPDASASSNKNHFFHLHHQLLESTMNTIPRARR